jgi:hyperosmotically inducible protein
MKIYSITIPHRAVLSAILCGSALLGIAGCDLQKPPTTAAKTSVGTEIDDSVVTAKVKSALLSDPEVKSFDLKVETRKGEVLLSGFVANQGQMDRAVQVVRGVPGVRIISNSMALKDGPATVGNVVDDGIVTAKVKSALLADPSIKSFDIAVVTRKGETQLSGFVDTPGQIAHAVELARTVEGVKSVANEMTVKK